MNVIEVVGIVIVELLGLLMKKPCGYQLLYASPSFREWPGRCESLSINLVRAESNYRGKRGLKTRMDIFGGSGDVRNL